MAILYLAVASLVIVVLQLGVLLILVCIATGAKNLKLGQKREIVNRGLDVCGNIGGVTNCIRVLCDWLHHRPQVSRQSSHQRVCDRAGSCVSRCIISNSGCGLCRPISAWCLVGRAEDVVTSIAASPASIVIVAPVVHIEQLGAIRLIAVVATVNQAHINTIVQSALERTKLDTSTLLGTVVVKAKNIGI